MSGERKEIAYRVVDLCGSYRAAVEAIMALGRALRRVAFTEPDAGLDAKKRPYYWTLNQDLLRKAFRSELPSQPDSLLSSLLRHVRSVRLLADPREGQTAFSRSAFQPFTLLRELLSGPRPDHELRYFAMVDIRKRWNRSLSSTVAHEFQILSDLLSSAIKAKTDQYYSGYAVSSGNTRKDSNVGLDRANRYHIGQSQSWHYDELLGALRQPITSDGRKEWSIAIDLFLECCFAVNYLQLHGSKRKWIVLRTHTIDSAFLVSNLFGMKTGITGFDDLFGGGGLILSDSYVSAGQSGGRALLTLGRYGTGKSLLALQFGVEVARKGGLAYLMTVEQSPEESLYGLASVCGLPPPDLVEIAADAASARRVLEHPSSKRGALVIMNALKESFADFRTTFKMDLKAIQQYPLRLVIVDAISAIPLKAGDERNARSETLDMLHEAKRSGTNVWLVAEEGVQDSDALLHYENISDTVIRLSTEKVLPYSQRHFEITKSRFQREQRGKHSFSILPGKGFTIYPSAGAVSARIRPRSVRPPDTPVEFGVSGLDQILGKDAICAGDVIVLQGPTGTFKTPLGLLFLLGTDRPTGGFARESNVESLLVTAGNDPSTIRHLLPGKLALERGKEGKTIRDIRVCSMAGGYIKPGYILHSIEEEFLAARLARHSIDRIMVDNVSHWDLSCPFVQEERTFGDTLVDLLRRHQVTSIFTCNEVNGSNSSTLQESIVDTADCIIQLQRVEFRGSYHIMLRVLKTRSMRHRREAFELHIGPHKIDVKVNPSLLRISLAGGVEPLKIRLFLHHQTEPQRKQNERFVAAVSSIISPYVEIDTNAQDSNDLVKAWNLGTASALDELQVLQVDEFHLPDWQRVHLNESPVWAFDHEHWKSEWDDLLPRLKKRILDNRRRFLGLPLYQNIGLLVYRPASMEGSNDIGIKLSWEAIAVQAERWEHNNPESTSVFFDFETEAEENYNCLFLEILLALCPGLASRGHCRLEEWMTLEPEQAMSAGKLFRRLCRRTHFLKKPTGGNVPRKASSQAHVWRLWYSEVNNILSLMDNDERQGIRITALPNNITVAGEWYLTIPAYSSAPDVGLQIMKLLTTHDAELNRLSTGIGLPTRASFYNSDLNGGGVDLAISPYFSMGCGLLKKLVHGAFPRSNFEAYAQISSIMASHLRRIIELPDAPDNCMEETIKTIFEDFKHQVSFVGA